jgi:CDP-diacylglycerol--glycerol-3-phosphate 3-phosphatidyltransferase
LTENEIGVARGLASSIPLGLTLLRALLAPVVVLLALFTPDGLAFAVCLSLAFVSDILDGVIARRLGIATAGLRRLDSVADSLFYVAATFAAWHLYPAVIRDHLGALLVLGALELARYVFDALKFGREASYHMWSSKAWGVALFLGFFSLLALGQAGALVTLAIYLGIAADLEGLAISCVLPAWQCDVPSLVHAWRLRQGARDPA